ncbi:hypothetical protein JAO29_10475 [Edaphobacter sp. HDX4]|uniref:hypothetical protein n=1 Tax=Edaphobacter sp. HDX4 TaxID=2794064 RepID=UPI002FE5820D
MYLTATGMQDATGIYRHLWGFYVRGFKPWHHCFACFYGTQERVIRKDMRDDRYDLPEPTHYFYLCGVASGAVRLRGERNLHLAVRPKRGSLATVKSFYGPMFTIHDAEEITIQPPIQSLPELSELYTGCKNFRFAAQMYEAASLGPDAPRELIRTPRVSDSLEM